MNHWLIFCFAGLALATGFSSAGAQPPAQQRFLAEWCDGTRTSAAEITDWSWVDKQPRLGERPLYDLGNRARWVRDVTLEPPPPASTVIEFVGGDQLPGKVVAHRAAKVLPELPVPAHLEVEPTVSFDRPSAPSRSHLRVTTEWIRRIIWERRAQDRYTPSTVFCRDGRQLHFRSLRWQEASVRLLLDDGQTQLLFEEIAELHMPPIDPWEALFAQRAILTPTAASLFMTVDSAHGLRATTSLERFEARSIGREADSKNWIHLVHPAWSLDGLYLYHHQIRQRTFFGSHEVPLTAIPPSRSVHRAALTSAWKHARWENGIHGGQLTAGDDPFGWGIGVHAHHELEFDLPAAVRTFRTRFALDASAGGGGCVRAIVYNGSTDTEPLFESRPIIGSRTVTDTGRMALAPTIQDHARLVLVADAMFDDAPPGADPLDVRDAFNWLEPMVELNPDEAFQALTTRWPRAMPALNGWQTPAPHLDGWEIEHALYVNAVSPIIRVEGNTWSLKRKLSITEQAPRMVFRVTHPDRRINPGRVRVLVGGEKLLEKQIDVSNDPGQKDPLSVSLEAYVGREIEVELQFETPTPGATLDWRGAVLLGDAAN